MNKTLRKLTKKQREHKARRLMTSVHILIAVVAIIECVLLVSFTTYSWIESNSSLVIQNGPESSQIADQTTTKKMDIASALHSTINLNYSGDTFAPLNDFFSEVKYFEFAKATSSDGRNLFFPCRNNTYSTAGKYRRGDTVDYNTSFLYFDFIISNKDAGTGVNLENRDVFFDESADYRDIFTVTGGDLTAEQRSALESAMRMSITTQYGSSAASTKIYSKTAYSGSTDYNSAAGTGSYKSIDITSGQSGTMNRNYAYDENHDPTTHDRNSWVTTSALEDSVYKLTNNVIDADRLFVVKKNGETKVSFRIWFDVWDPEFRSVFNLDSLDYSQFETSEAAYWNIPDATVGIKFRLKTSGNDLRSIYFDDYTLTNQTGINIDHLTDEPDNDNDPNTSYSVWFYTWQPHVPASPDHEERLAGYYAIQLTKESRDSAHTLWSANTATQSEMEYLMNAGGYSNAFNVSNSADRYKKSYFCYGDFSTKTAIYRWELDRAPLNEDFIFNAYSYMPNSSYTASASSSATVSGRTVTWTDCVVASGGTKRGVGVWQDDTAGTTMTLLKFRDMATAVTSDNYNGGANFQIMNAQAVSDNHSHYLVFANNYNHATLGNNFTDAVAKTTAAMYYDSSASVFKSYVPTCWLTGSTGVSFTYSPGGVFNANGAYLRWYSGVSAATQNGGEYIYTALGYSNKHNVDSLAGVDYLPNLYSGSDGFLKGVGTWVSVEEIKFSTELIDSDLSSGYRYFVGISDSYSQGYYVMIPDASNMTFSAYVPSGTGSASAGISFLRYALPKSDVNVTSGPTAYWYGNKRYTYGTFYPVDCDDDDATVEYTHGYWNLSVLVDGTYENLIYDTLTDGSGSAYAPVVTDGSTTVKGSVDYSARVNYGLLEYSYNYDPDTGLGDWYTLADDTSDTLNNCIDRYRFYVPAEDQTVVYWRWTPYKGYSVTFYSDYDTVNQVYTQKTISAADTHFEYTHNVTDVSSSGIYLVVTEAPNAVTIGQNQGQGQ